MRLHKSTLKAVAALRSLQSALPIYTSVLPHDSTAVLFVLACSSAGPCGRTSRAPRRRPPALSRPTTPRAKLLVSSSLDDLLDVPRTTAARRRRPRRPRELLRCLLLLNAMLLGL